MGTWGTGVLDDDFAMSVYETYMDLFDAKVGHVAIRAEIEAVFGEGRCDDDDKFSFWFALAKAQWECGVLEEDVRRSVCEMIDSGMALNHWKERSDDPSDYSSRKRKLGQFKRTISKDKAKPRTPKKYRFVPACFEPGDCLVFNTADGRFGAALVLEIDNSDKQEGHTLFGLIDYLSPDPPPIDVFENPKWLLLTHHAHKGTPELTWCGAKSIDGAPPGLEVKYHVDALPTDYQEHDMGWGGWARLKQLDMQVEWDEKQ